MRRFRYYRDPLFLAGCCAYAINRWLIKPRVHHGFFHDHFNDCWLIPCALPVVLWLHRRLTLRAHDDPPRVSEIALHLVLWSALFEWIGPQFMPHATADPWDVVSYWTGGALAWFWWHRSWLATCQSENFRDSTVEKVGETFSLGKRTSMRPKTFPD